MAEGKWFTDLNGNTLLGAAARQVLEARLAGIPDRLALAVHEADKDLEHVHQLRVATRRARAALNIFSCCLPDKDFRRARRGLRRLRRAAGAARDWDVFADMVAARALRARQDHRPGLDFLLGFATGQRAAAQEDLVRTTQRKPRDWQAFVVAILDAVRDPEADGAARHLKQLAMPHLTGLVRELEEAARRDLKPYEHLHQVRILGKRLRYAMEIFAGCFGPELREKYYPAIVDMQEILGQANDSYVASQRLGALGVRLEAGQPKAWKRLQTGLESVLKFHQRRLPSLRRQFETWWKAWVELNMVGHLGMAF